MRRRPSARGLSRLAYPHQAGGPEIYTAIIDNGTVPRTSSLRRSHSTACPSASRPPPAPASGMHPPPACQQCQMRAPGGRSSLGPGSASGHLYAALVAQLELFAAHRTGQQQRSPLHSLEMGTVVWAHGEVHSCRVGNRCGHPPQRPTTARSRQKRAFARLAVAHVYAGMPRPAHAKTSVGGCARRGCRRSCGRCRRRCRTPSIMAATSEDEQLLSWLPTQMPSASATHTLELAERPPVNQQSALHLGEGRSHLVILLLGERCGQVLAEPVEMLADDPADLLIARGPMPRVRWRSAGRGRHARQRRHAECLVLVCEQPGPGSQIAEELVEHRVEGVRLGDPSVSLLHVQNHVNDLAEHLVDGGGRIVAPGRAHAGTDAGRRPPHAQGRATGLRHPTRGTSLPLTSGSSRPASPDEIRSVNKRGMDRAYRGRPCPGGCRDSVSPANPAVAAGDGHLYHETPPGRQHGCAISGHKGWAVTIRGRQARNRAHWNRRYGRQSCSQRGRLPRARTVVMRTGVTGPTDAPVTRPRPVRAASRAGAR
jgi:hypothetical protein